MRRSSVVPLFVGLLWLLYPTNSYSAPRLQSEGTIPAPTATQVPLRLATFVVNPPAIVAGDEFTIAFQIESTGSLVIEEVVVTIEDQQANWALIEPGGDKRIFLYNVGTGINELVTVPLRYDNHVSGTRQLIFVMEYTYVQNEERLVAVHRESILLLVTAPTPTPTYTFTPTPTPTFTHTPTPTPLPPVQIPQIPVQIVPVTVVATPTLVNEVGDQTESGQAELTVTRATDGGATSEGNMGEDSSTGQESTPERGDAPLPILLGFTAPSALSPGQPFPIGIIVRNLGDATVNAVLIEWQGCDAMGIAPIGGGQWHVTEVPAGGEAAQSANLFVAANAAEGVYACELQATSVTQSQIAPRTASVYFWVQQPTAATGTSTPLPTLPPTLPPSPVVEAVEEAAAEAQETFWEWFVRLLLGR